MTTAWVGILAAISFATEHIENENRTGAIPLLDQVRGQNSYYPGRDIFVVRDAHHWTQVWRATYGGASTGTPVANIAIPPVPPIEFRKYMVLAVMGGEVSETGDYRYVGGSFRGKNSVLRVDFVPYRGPLRIQARPYAFFMIPRLEGRVSIQMPDQRSGQWRDLTSVELPSLGD